MLHPLEAVQRRVRLDRNALHRRDRFLQVARRPHESSGSAESGDEVREAPARLLVDLRARCLDVRAPVRGVGVLVRVEVEVRPRGRQASRAADRAVGPFERIGQDRLGAVGREDRSPLAGRVARQAQGDAETESAADHRVRDPRVSRGGVEDALARSEEAALDAVQDHRAGRTILDAAARIQVLRLGEEAEARHARRRALELEEGRPPDGRDEVRHGVRSSPDTFARKTCRFLIARAPAAGWSPHESSAGHGKDSSPRPAARRRRSPRP